MKVVSSLPRVNWGYSGGMHTACARVCVGGTAISWMYQIQGGSCQFSGDTVDHLKQKGIQRFSLEITSEYISQISKQTRDTFFNTCDFGIPLNLIIKLKLVQVL